MVADSAVGDDRSDIKLKGPLYISGIQTSLRKSSIFLSSGLQLQSFRGCLKKIRINYRYIPGNVYPQSSTKISMAFRFLRLFSE